jgi:hypothetical protein
MAAEHHIHAPSLAFHADQPLIGIVLMEDGHEVVRSL